MSKTKKITEGDDTFSITFEATGMFNPNSKAYRNVMSRLLGRIQADQEKPLKKKGQVKSRRKVKAS